MLGVAFEQAVDSARMSGFLFDMNVFFQRLLSRFFHENLTTRILKDEWSLRYVFAFAPDANPKRRRAPAPRPDFALFRGKQLSGFIDAKYGDGWEKRLPTEWLYQLSIYALASPTRTSILLYATMSDDARDERLEVHQPVQWSNKAPASVIPHPVLLSRLAELLDAHGPAQLTNDRRQWAEELTVPHVRKGDRAPSDAPSWYHNRQLVQDGAALRTV
jgi:5-methylcytosine-specific restriction enzyme subunit McrC